MREGGGGRVGSNKLVELKKKKISLPWFYELHRELIPFIFREEDS